MKRIICLAILGIGKGENHMKAMWKMRQKEPSKTVPLVVCVLIVSACFAILLIGCGHIPTDNGGDETSGGTGLPVEEFLFNRSISFYNGWLYSSLGAGGGLNKYKVDLLQEELVLPTGWSQALAINQDGRCI
ncbi:MAG: hypothetical protein FWG03_03595, partial [Clostridiales bacterium]|nr:hypothetical protein [Clostridiales bacterium]